MKINLIWDASVTNAPNPSEFEAAITYAAGTLDTLLANAITVNILVGWGEDDNGTYSVTNGEATGGPLGGVDLTYAQLKTDLTAAYQLSDSVADATALSNLPADPFSGADIYVSPAQEKAWGLLPSTGTEVDGAIGFNPLYTFTYDPANRAVPGDVDLIGVAEHELTHALGRVASYPTGSVGGGGQPYTALDLFRYATPSQLATYGGQPAYFSIDDGLSGQNYPYDTLSDIGDWASTISGDAFGYGDYGQTLQLSATDLTEMNVIGFDVAHPPQAAAPPNFFNNVAEAGILWRNTAGNIELWNPNGSGGFTYDSLSAVSPSWQIAGTGDFNGSDEAGILWRNASTGGVELWNANGSGGFTYDNLGSVSLSWQVAGTGDFNGTGEAGILWRNSTNGDAEIWNPNGSGGFAYDNLGSVNTSWQVAGTGDFNGIGEAGILWRNATNGDVELWNSNGSGGFTYDNLGAVNSSWQIAGTGDFTGTGQDSILWRNSNGGAELWNPDGSGGFTYQNLGSVNASWQVAETGDFTGSGQSGILWRNTSGATELWNPNGSGGFTYENLGVVATNWSVQKIFA